MDGFINLHKESGVSSHQSIAALRRFFSCKIGHAGTLDPLATGVLPVCLGKATRLAEYVTGLNKVYDVVISFGRETDSYDEAGNVIAQQDASHLRIEDVENLLPLFKGNILQKPPLISAIKQGGVPFYKRVRRGETPQLEKRPVVVYEMEIIDQEFAIYKPWLQLRILCGKGFYVRSLAHDLGQLLGVGAYVSKLKRLGVGPFIAEEAHTLSEIAQKIATGDNSFVLPIEFGIAHLPQFIAPPESLPSLTHGNNWRLKFAIAQDICRVESPKGGLIGLGKIDHAEEGGYILSMQKVLAEPLAKPQAADHNYKVVAIGNFDGFHIGHQELMRRVADLKEQWGGLSAVLTFNPHPVQYISGKTPPLLNTAAEKRYLAIEKNGLDALLELYFDENLRANSPQEFVDDVIVKRIGAQYVVVGFNFRFGAQGVGDAQLLKDLCAKRGVGVEIVEAVSGPYGVISSSLIRQYLQRGDMTAVNTMLGYDYAIFGRVIMGNQLGRKLGFPTANILPPASKALPPWGVYAGRAVWREHVYLAVINIGFKPTIDNTITQPLVEAHIIEAQPQLYGELLTVYFDSFLRSEQHFATLDALKEQIELDYIKARAIGQQLIDERRAKNNNATI